MEFNRFAVVRHDPQSIWSVAHGRSIWQIVGTRSRFTLGGAPTPIASMLWACHPLGSRTFHPFTGDTTPWPTSPKSKRSATKAPSRRTRSPSATTTPTRWSKARRCGTTCGSPSSTGTRSAARAATRSAPAAPCGRGKTAPTRSRTPRSASGVAFEFMEKLGVAVLLLPRPRRRPRRRDARRDERESRRGRQGAQGRAAADRHQAAVGHGQPVQQPALHARRGHQPERRRLRLRRGAGEEGARGHQGARRRRLHLLGRPRGLSEPAGTPT